MTKLKYLFLHIDTLWHSTEILLLFKFSCLLNELKIGARQNEALKIY